MAMQDYIQSNNYPDLYIHRNEHYLIELPNLQRSLYKAMFFKILVYIDYII